MLTASVAQIDTAFSCAILGEGEVDFNRNRPWSESGGYTTVYRGVLRYKGLEVALKKPRWGWADSGHDVSECQFAIRRPMTRRRRLAKPPGRKLMCGPPYTTPTYSSWWGF